MILEEISSKNMEIVENTQKLKAELIEAGKKLAAKNLLPATSGNLSARFENLILVTVSGKDKAQLTEEDFMLVNYRAEAVEDISKKPSAETLLHSLVYENYPKANYIYHVHSSASVILSKKIGANKEILLENYELLKALSGINTHSTTEIVPIFRNSQNIASLAQDVKQFLSVKSDIHAFVLEGHGFYTWGATHKECLRHVEALDTLFSCEIEMMKLN
jgi:methylthioribulose-1-phosphate dehydratase